MRSGISTIRSVDKAGKFEPSEVVHRSRRVNDFQPLLNLLRIKEISQIQFDGPARAAQNHVVPLGGLNGSAEFLDAAAAHGGPRARRRAKAMRADFRQRIR